MSVHDLEPVGAGVVDAEVVGQLADDLDEAAADEPHGEAESLERAHQGASTRGQLNRLTHLVENGGGQTRQGLDAGAEGLLEVQLTRHGAGRHLGDLRFTAAVRREQLDDLLLDERRVDVEDDEAPAAAREPTGCDRDVDPLRGGDERELGAQGGHVGPGDVELHGRHRVAGQAPDAVDVGPVVGDACRDEGDGVGAQRCAEHDHGRTSLARPRIDAGALDDREAEPESVRGHGGCVAQLVDMRAGTQQDGERQVTVDHDLLDVEDLGGKAGQRSEERPRDSGAVVSRHGHAEGLDVRSVRAVRFGHRVRLVTPSTTARRLPAYDLSYAGRRRSWGGPARVSRCRPSGSDRPR